MDGKPPNYGFNREELKRCAERIDDIGSSAPHGAVLLDDPLSQVGERRQFRRGSVPIPLDLPLSTPSAGICCGACCRPLAHVALSRA